MTGSLVEQLYSAKQSAALKELFKQDLSSRPALKQAISSKLITDNSKILTSNPIDILFLICLSAKFADSEDECNRIAITVYQYYSNVKTILPSIVEDRGLVFSSKCLISLAFYKQALEKKWNHHGAPKPDFYRQLSKNIYNIYDQTDIAAHHELWEGFLGEMFV